jgi:hypothetical protein
VTRLAALLGFKSVVSRTRDNEVIRTCDSLFIHSHCFYTCEAATRMGVAVYVRDGSAGAHQATHQRGGCQPVPKSSDHKHMYYNKRQVNGLAQWSLFRIRSLLIIEQWMN